MRVAINVAGILGIIAAPCALAQEVPADLVTVVLPKPKPSPTTTKSVPYSATVGVLPLDLINTDQVSALIGHGYDPITGRVLPMQCVIAKGPETRLEGGTVAFKRKRFVTSEKSNASASSSSFGISAVFKAISLGVGTSQASGSAFNSVDSYGRLYNRIATSGGEYQLVQWAPGARELLRDDPAGFASQCGTRFVRGLYSGQLLDTLTSFVVREDQSSSSSATSVSVGVKKIFGASASFGSAAADANQYSDAFIENNGRGALGVAVLAASSPPSPPGTQPPGTTPPSPAPTPPPAPAPAPGSGASAGASTTVETNADGIKTMLDYYENGFANAVAALPEDKLKSSALPLYIITDHYQGNLLPLASKVPIWADDIYDAVNARIDTYNSLVQVIADLTTALTPGPNQRLGVFYTDDPTYPAAKKLKDAKLKLAGFQKAVRYCSTLLSNGVEQPGPKKAAEMCSEQLDASLSDEDVTKVALDRKFK